MATPKLPRREPGKVAEKVDADQKKNDTSPKTEKGTGGNTGRTTKKND